LPLNYQEEVGVVLSLLDGEGGVMAERMLQAAQELLPGYLRGLTL